MKTSRGRRLVILLALVFFAVGHTGISMAKEGIPVFRHEPLKEFVIGHYPIDVSEMRGKTRDDFNRMVQEIKSLGPDRRMVVIGSASYEASNLYNYDLGWERAEKVRQALLRIFPDATIDIATKGERPDIRQVKVYYGASCTDIPVRYLKKTESKLIICDSVIFEVNPPTVTVSINLAQNDFKLEPGEVVRMHARSRNNEFGHEDDVIAIGRSTDDGRLIFQFPNMIASSSDADQFLDQAVRSDDQPSKVYFEKKDQYYKKEN